MSSTQRAKGGLIGQPTRLVEMTPEDQAAETALREAEAVEQQRLADLAARRDYAEKRKADMARELIVLEGDTPIDVIGHEIGMLIDALRVLRAELEAATGRSIDLGPIEGHIVKIDEIRARHPKPSANNRQ